MSPVSISRELQADNERPLLAKPLGIVPYFAAITLLSVMDNPTTFYLLSSFVICIGCLSILVPLFLPKYLERHTQEPTLREAQNRLRRDKKSNSNAFSDAASMASVGASSGKVSSFITTQPTAIRRTVSKGASVPKKSADAALNNGHDDSPSQDDFMKPSVVVTKAILAVQRPVVEGMSNTKNALISGISKQLQIVGLKNSCDDSKVESEDEPRTSPETKKCVSRD